MKACLVCGIANSFGSQLLSTSTEIVRFLGSEKCDVLSVSDLVSQILNGLLVGTLL